MADHRDLDDEGYLSVRFPDDGIRNALKCINGRISWKDSERKEVDWKATDKWRKEGMNNLPNLRNYGGHYNFDAKRHLVVYIPPKREGDEEEDVGLSQGSKGGRYVNADVTQQDLVRASADVAKARKRLEMELGKSSK